MSLAKTHKGFVTFITLVGVGALGLGYFLYSSWSESAESMENYEISRSRLVELEAGKPYPEKANLAKVQETAKDFGAEVKSLRASIFAAQAKPRVLSDTAFQQELIKRTDELKKLASEKSVTLPDNFAFGMERYQSGAPASDAASDLAWQLDGIVAVVEEIVNNGGTAIGGISRDPLRVEEASPKDERKPVAGPSVYEDQALQVNFSGSQQCVQHMVSYLTSSAGPYFYEIRLLRLANENPYPPEKSSTFEPTPLEGTGFDSAPGTSVPAPPPDPEPTPDAAVNPAPTTPTPSTEPVVIPAPAPLPPAVTPPPAAGAQGPTGLLAQAGPATTVAGSAPVGTPAPPPNDPPVPVDPSLEQSAKALSPPVAQPMVDTRVLMGLENVHVYMQLRIVKFTPPPAEVPAASTRGN